MPVEELLIAGDGPIEVLEVGLQGPPGPRGLPGLPGGGGGGGGELAQYLAGVGAISGHSVVSFAADGSLVPATCTVDGYIGAVAGVAENAADPGAVVSVRRLGLLEFAGWNWVPDLPVLLGANGALVQALVTGARFIQLIGWARSPTLLHISLQPPIRVP